MAGEGLGVGVQTEVLVQLARGHLVEGLALVVSRRLGLVVVGQEDQEVTELALLEETHQTGVQSLRGGSRNLLDLAILEHITSINGLELQVTGHLRVKKNLRQLAAGHDELGDQVDIPISGVAQVGSGSVGSELLEQVQQTQRRSISAIIVVSIHMQYTLSVHRQKSTDDALRETGSHDDSVVFSVSERFTALRHPRKCLCLLALVL
mmetsp:Transcript_34658/g.59726  ORF Transcript_34658/g.59726 Transcript_34658/m.59726 type:complete len:207 (+) Transcript_34658:1464-2084(+)